jgi:hypothetical protein
MDTILPAALLIHFILFLNWAQNTKHEYLPLRMSLELSERDWYQ